MVIRGDSITLRYLKFDLSTLPTVLSGTNPKTVTIHAQTVVLTSRLDVSYDLVIVARQVYLSSSASFRYDKKPYSLDLPVTQCYKSSIHLDCSLNVPMTLISYYGNGRIDIYAESISGAPSCHSGRIVTSTPKFDVTALRAAIACAELIVSTSGYSKTAYNILSYVKHVGHDAAGFNSAADGQGLRSLAESINTRMSLKKAGKRLVPVLSQAAYTDMLGRYEAIFNVYQSRFNNIFLTNLNINNRVTDLRATVEKANDALSLQEKKLEFAASSVKESELTLDKLEEEFVNAQLALDEARRAFEDGLAEYKKQVGVMCWHFLPPVVAYTTGLSHNRFTWRPL